MDVLARAESVDAEIERMAEKRRDGRSGRDQANAEAALQRAEDRRRLQVQREENRDAWITHLRRVAVAHMKAARSAQARARTLERGKTA